MLKVIMSLVDKMKQQNPKINEGVSKEAPSLKFNKQEIEFLLYLVQEGMIPGKQLIEAVSVVEKLQKSYKEQQ
mgnify:CR=1 FL=1|jgi:hypothetical protein|tara:strand:- start:176 stop:394 length:219 start_codon:yes stop_codon:yes gene_type:complete